MKNLKTEKLEALKKKIVGTAFLVVGPDPPGDCLRIRLVVAILEGCGSYFLRGAGLRKLSMFFSVFQR